MKRRAYLFGLNYEKDPSARLYGCINDVLLMAKYLKNTHDIPCQVFTDQQNDHACTALGIISTLYEAATLSHKENLDFIWFHYSGHGANVIDRNNDERDGRDECLVPSDFRRSGVITDDYICNLFKLFNPKTRVVFVFDCCHSGTLGDLKYSWSSKSSIHIENALCPVRGRIMTLSACLDSQVAADAYNVLGDKKYVGALTGCLQQVFDSLGPERSKKNIFEVLTTLQKLLKEKGFSQMPRLGSTYNLIRDPIFIL